LEDRVWPVQGAAHGLRAVALAVDMQGGGHTTENAYRFYRSRRKAGQAGRWHLTRGSGGAHTDRVWLKAPERVSRGNASGRRVAADIKILNMATDRLKDAVAASLRMVEAGANICLVPEWMDDQKLTEATAERRGPKGWQKRPGMVRNETFDHLVQARAMHIHIGGERVDPSAPPHWARIGADNSYAVAMLPTGDAGPDGAADDQEQAPEPVAAPRAKRRARTVRLSYLQRG
jgi:phage terminase large subunit GpA-like protein